MSFSGLILTNTGRNELAGAELGGNFNITDIVFGDGNYNGTITNIKELVSPVMSLPVSKAEQKEDKVILECDFNSNDVPKAFYWREIGIIANGKLCYYDNSREDAEYIDPQSDHVVKQKRMRFVLLVSSEVHISATVDSSLYALEEELEKEVNRATGAEEELRSAKHTHDNKDILDSISVVNNTADRDKVVRSLNVCFSESTGTSKKGWCFIIGRAIIQNQYDDNVLIGTIFTCDDNEQTSCSMSYVWRVNQQLSMTESPESAINVINYDGLNPQNLWASITKNGDSEKYVELWYTTDQIDNRRYGSTVHSVYGNIFVPDSVSLANNAGANKCAVGAMTGNVKSAGAIKDSSNNNMITVSNAMDGLTNNDALWLAVFQGDMIRKVNKNLLSVGFASHLLINDIDEGSDLNNYTSPGFYASYSNKQTLSLKNSPTQYAFSMVIGRHAGYWQEITEFPTGKSNEPYPKTFKRNYYYADGWGDWYRVYTTIDAPTAENVGALPLSGGEMGENASIIMTGGELSSDRSTLAFSSKTNSGVTTKAFISIPNGSDGGCFSMLYYIGDTFMGNRCDLGTNDRKWRNIYATNGTIQTSDLTKKSDITSLADDKTKAFIMGLNPVSYKMTDGTSGRTHYGLIAQDIEKLLAALGIDSKDFAGFIKSPKAITKDTDEDGNPLKNPIEEVVEGEYDYALRYDEFIAPLIKTVQNQQKEIEELREELANIKAEIRQR